MKETHFQRASPLCAQREMPLHGGQVGSDPAGQLLCTACQGWQGVQTEPSPQFPETTQLEEDWGCPCHRTAKELEQSCMGRKWASCSGNTVGGVGADIPSSRTFSPSAVPTPGSISCQAFQDQYRKRKACKHGILHSPCKMSSFSYP